MDYLIKQKLIIMDVTEVDEHGSVHDNQVTIPDAKCMRKMLLLQLEDTDGHKSCTKTTSVHQLTGSTQL